MKFLYKHIRGSHLFGTNVEGSDIDNYGIFIGELDWFLGLPRTITCHVSSNKNDDSFDELGKFVSQLEKSNPDSIISLYVPPKFIIYKDPVLDPIFEMKEELLTKECLSPFTMYAISQIRKARGKNKKISMDPDEMKTRKSALDFCYTINTHITSASGKLTEFLEKYGLKERYCGLSKIPNVFEGYRLFYDWAADKDMTVSKYKEISGSLSDMPAVIGYRGIISINDPESSQLRLSSIPKGEIPLISFQYNSSGFSQHCKKYQEYQNWMQNVNKERFVIDKEHGYNAKNLSTCIRILTMGIEIAEGKGVLIDRTGIDRDFLLQVKNHELTYSEVMSYTESLEKRLSVAFKTSQLPEKVDSDKLNRVLIRIRREYYEI